MCEWLYFASAGVVGCGGGGFKVNRVSSAMVL